MAKNIHDGRAKNIHDGHRTRLRKRIYEGGIDKLEEHEVLEYLLFSFVPRRDTNALAHRLLDEFGSLSNVMNAKPIHLKKISGMTDNASLFLTTLPEIFREYVVSASHKNKVMLANHGEVRNYLGNLFTGLNYERVYAVALDVNNRVIGQKYWTNGKRAEVEISPAQISEFAEKMKAVSILIAHNHPGGSIIPSQSDVDITEKIWNLFYLIGYSLQDHLIFNDTGECYSFEENGYFKKWKDEKERQVKVYEY